MFQLGTRLTKYFLRSMFFKVLTERFGLNGLIESDELLAR